MPGTLIPGLLSSVKENESQIFYYRANTFKEASRILKARCTMKSSWQSRGYLAFRCVVAMWAARRKHLQVRIYQATRQSEYPCWQVVWNLKPRLRSRRRCFVAKSTDPTEGLGVSCLHEGHQCSVTKSGDKQCDTARLKETSYLSLELHCGKERRPLGTVTSLSSTISAKSNRVNYVFFNSHGNMERWLEPTAWAGSQATVKRVLSWLFKIKFQELHIWENLRENL